MLDDYENIHFIDEYGKMDLTACPKRNTQTLLDKGYQIDKNHKYIEDIQVFEREYFCGFDIDNNNYIITHNTYTVHHYNGSWVNNRKKIIKKIKRKLSSLIGIENYKKIRNFKIKYTKNAKNEKEKK